MTDGPDSSQHPVEEKPAEFVKNSSEISKGLQVSWPEESIAN